MRDVTTYLPRGMIINPTATPRRCSEVEMESYACPANTQIGVANVFTSIIAPGILPEPVYNLEPAPGKASNFGFIAVFYPVHIEGGVRPGDYTEMAETRGIPNLQAKPAMGIQLLLWGDPSAPSFDYAREEFLRRLQKNPLPGSRAGHAGADDADLLRGSAGRRSRSLLLGTPKRPAG